MKQSTNENNCCCIDSDFVKLVAVFCSSFGLKADLKATHFLKF